MELAVVHAQTGLLSFFAPSVMQHVNGTAGVSSNGSIDINAGVL